MAHNVFAQLWDSQRVVEEMVEHVANCQVCEALLNEPFTEHSVDPWILVEDLHLDLASGGIFGGGDAKRLPVIIVVGTSTPRERCGQSTREETKG